MLSKTESSSFVRDVLKIQELETEKENNTLEFLNKIICAVFNTLPFQCLTLMAEPLEKRHRPTDEEIKSSMFLGQGGLCYSLNLFTFYLLKSLGYDVYLNTAQVLSPTTTQDDHLLVLLKNLKEDSGLHLVDVGCGIPAFQAISLDFETESRVFHESYMRYKFIKEGRKIIRLHDPAGSALNPGFPCLSAKPDDFKPFYVFEINLKTDVEDIRHYFDVVYTDPDRTPFHRSLRAMKFRNYRHITICNSKLAVEKENGEITVTILGSDEDLEKAYKTYFPEFDESSVKNAIKNWRQCKMSF